MNSIDSLLLSLEGKCRMNISAPASKDMLDKISKLYPIQFKAIEGLYTITDGVEIDVPGTVFYSIEEILSVNERNLEDGCLEIGHMNFGDTISVDSEGKVVQIELETGDVFLDWDSLEAFLNDELEALS